MEKNIDPNAVEGMRIRLISMDDDFGAVDPQMEGTIRRIDDIGTLHVNWDDGRTLGVIPGVDEYMLLPPESEQTPVGVDMFEETDGPITKRYNQEFKRITNTTKPKLELESNDKVKGGVADKLSVQDIAKKHKVPIGDIRKEIKKGTKIEMEHTSDRTLAKEIATDHVTEFPDFYTNKEHGAIASEKGLEKVHESVKEDFKVALERIVSTIKTASFQHKDTVDTMIDNFYHKYKGNVEDSEKFSEIYTNLKQRLEDKFNVDEITAAGGGGSTGAFVGPLSTTKKKNESKTIKVGDFINEVSRVNKLRNDGTYDGNSWVGDKDSDGWLFDDDPAWEGGEIIDILAKLDINWKDDNLSVKTIKEAVKNHCGNDIGNGEIVSEGWLIKTKEDKVALTIFKRIKKVFPEDAAIRYDRVRFTLPGVEKDPIIEVFYERTSTMVNWTLSVNGRELGASRWVTKKIFKYLYNELEDRKVNKDFRRIQADLTDPEFAQDAFDQMNESDGVVSNAFGNHVKSEILKKVKEKGVESLTKFEKEFYDKLESLGELDETTTFASALGDSGTYVGPSFAAPKGKHSPSKKPIWKGGTIVQDIKNDGVLVSEVKVPKYGSDIENTAKKSITLRLGGETLNIGGTITFNRSQSLLRRIFPQSYIVGEPYTNFKKNETYEVSNIWSDYKLNNNDTLLTLLTDFQEDLAIEFTNNEKKVVISYEDLKRLYGKNFFRVNNNVSVNEINKIKWVKGGKYVKLKEKCTKFNNQPWCNSGNASDPLELSDTTTENIDNISEMYGLSKEYILEKIKSKINH